MHLSLSLSRSSLALLTAFAWLFAANGAHAGGTPTTISFDNDETRDEDNGTMTFVLRVDNSSPTAFDVTLTEASGTATSGTDFIAPTTVTFAANAVTANAVVTLTDDTIDEANETFTLTIESTTLAATLTGEGTASATGTIDDDDARPDIDFTGADFDEADGTISVTVTLSNTTSSQDITVDFATSDDTATEPGDYTSTSGTLTIPAGATSGTIEVDITPDVVDEPDQDFIITLSNPSANVTISDDNAVITILDDDATPTITLGTVSLSEGAGATTFAVVLSGQTERTVDVNVDTTEISGEASIPADLVDVNTSITFAALETSKSVAITIVNDTLREDDEDVSVVLNVTSANGPSDNTVTLTIAEDDPIPTVTVAKTQDAIEGGSEGSDVDDAIFTVTLSGASESSVTVDVDTVNGAQPGGAVAGEDYDAAGLTLTFTTGQLSKTVNVDSNAEALDEDVESFTLLASNPVGATLGTASATATITDDDAPPTVSINDVAIAEGDASKPLTFTLTLSAVSGRSLSVQFDTASGTATEATDFTDTSALVTFAAGELTQTVAVAVAGDLSDENDETFAVALTSPANVTIADGAGIGTITDNDAPPTVSITGATVSEGNSGTSTLAFTVSLSVASGKAVSVTATTTDGTARQPADYTARTQVIAIPAGTASVPFDVTVNGDGTFEGNDTVNATLTLPTNATLLTATAVGTITNDDPVPTLSVSDALLPLEGNSGVRNMTFTVSLSNPSDTLVTFNFRTEDVTATAGTDYSGQDTNAIIAAGSTSTTINIVVAGDGLDEPDEIIKLVATGASGANLGDVEGFGVITDDDDAPVIAVVSPQPAFEGNTGTANLRFEVVLNAASGQEVRVSVQTTPGTAAAPTDYQALPLTQLVFAPGTTLLPVNITAFADVLDEDDIESFTLTLSAPTNATLAPGNASIGSGGIRDDDATPTLVINDVTLAPEGNVGTEPATFTVTLSAPSGRPVTYSFATADGDATAGTDYFAQSGTRILAPGSVSETITVDVLRETAEEGDEIFSVELSGVANAILLDDSGICVILNDDDGPVTGADGPFSVGEEQVLTVAQPGVLANDSDADGDPLFAELRDATNPLLEGVLQFFPDGGFSFAPVADFAGAVTFSYVATDGVNDSAPRVVTINVVNLNDAPVLTPDVVETVQLEDADEPPTLLVDELAFDLILDPDAIDLPGIAIVAVPDADDGVLQMSLDDGATWLPITSASATAAVLVPPDALVRFLPEPDASPTVNATFRAWDGSDLAPVGPDNPAAIVTGENAPFSADTATLRFVVTPVNDAPLFVAPTPDSDDVIVAIEGLVSTIDLAATDVDDDGADLTFTIDDTASTLPASADFDASANDGTASLTVDAQFFEAGSYVIRFVVTDAAGLAVTRDVSIVISFNDGDLDGLPDAWEVDVGLDPESNDSDGDTIADLDEAGAIGLDGDLADLLDPVDTDDDGTPDALDDDADDDGVLDRDEAGDDDLETPPLSSDDDGDEDFRDVNSDDDAQEDFDDNCRVDPNDDQADFEGDGIGDACDPDGDGDRLADDLEPQLGLSDENPDEDGDTILDGDEVGDPSEPFDSDDDGTIDAFETDSDDDEVLDADEAGDDAPGTFPVDTDEDGAPDYRDTDSDDDEVFDDVDNCRITKNADQLDRDEDGVGDACLQVCGDGRLQEPEQCDDGNTTSGDLCDADCNKECDQPEICDGLDQDCDELIDLARTPGGGLVSVCEDRDLTVKGGGLASACGCSSGPDASLPIFALALLALLLRRRRRAIACAGEGRGLPRPRIHLRDKDEAHAAPRFFTRGRGRPRPSPSRSGTLLVLLLLATTTTRAAPGDGMQVQQFTPVGGGAEDLVLLEGTAVNGHLRPAAGIYLDYSYATLNLSDDLTGASVSLLEHHVGATVVGSLSFLDRGQVALQIPVTAFQSAGVDDVFIPAALSPVALGDVRLSGRFSILDDVRKDGPGLAAGVAVTAPLGEPAQLQGYGFLTAEPKVMGGWRLLSGKARVLANLGYLLRPRQRLLGLEVGNELTWGVGGSFAAVPTLLDVVGEVNGRVAADLGIAIEGATTPLETLVGARWHVMPGHDVSAGLTLGITSGYGTPLFRLFAGYTFTLPGPDVPVMEDLAGPATPSDDPDGDGIKGLGDACANIAEDMDGIQDNDGCPDLDADEDGLPDNVDRCAEIAEDKDGFEDGDGCPDLDDDADRINIPDDKCPATPEDKDGFQDTDGCPDDDNDRDGVADAADRCPNEAGTIEGCTSAANAPITQNAAGTLEIPQRIYFESNGTQVTAEGQKFLEEIAVVLKQNENVRVEVQGHSDGQGDGPVNDELSLQRAKAVVDILVKLGVARQRFLLVVVAGNEPLAPNDTNRGRALNRRVQFRVLPN